MKRCLSLLLIFGLLLTGCGNKVEKKAKSNILDLTKMNKTIRFSEMQNIVANPDSYVGTTVIVECTANSVVDDTDGKTYYTCIVKDAAQCCAQGLEFRLKDGKYPKVGEDVKVKGKLKTYTIGDGLFITLDNAKILKS